MKQKYFVTDLVHIGGEKPQGIGTHRWDCDAIILYSDDEHGCRYDNGEFEYDVLFEDGNGCAWYPESCLTLIKRNQYELLKKWRGQ